MTVRLPKDLKRWYAEQARGDGMKLSKKVREALEQWRFERQVERTVDWKGETTSTVSVTA